MRRFAFVIPITAVLVSACSASNHDAGAGDGIPATGLVRVTSPASERVVRYVRDGNRILGPGDEYIGDVGRNVSKSNQVDSLVINATTGHWPIVSGKITIPFQWGNISLAQQSTVTDVVTTDWNATTFVDFQWCLNNDCPGHAHYDYLVINAADGDSAIGKQSGQQVCNVGSGINPLPTDNPSRISINHQLGHALGLYHEQQRSDRSFFVQYAPDMIGVDPATDPNSKQVPTLATDFGLYDFGSVMQMLSTDLTNYVWPIYFPEDGILKIDGTQITRSQYKVTKGDAYGVHEAYFGDPSYGGDVVVSLSRGARIDAYNAPIRGGFGWAPQQKVNDTIYGDFYATADLDSSGTADLIAVNHNFSHSISTNRSDGGGFALAATMTPSIPTDFCTSFDSCVFLDGDGQTDVNPPNKKYPDAIAFNASGVRIAHGTGTGTFSAPIAVPGPGGCPAGSVCGIADISGDGIPDFIQFTSSAYGPVYLGQRSGSPLTLSFQTSPSYWTLYQLTPALSSMKLRFADLNADGQQDTVMYDPVTGNIYGRLTYSNVVGFYYSGFTPTGTFTKIGGTSDVFLVGDVTGDVYPDAVLVAPNYGGNIFVAHGYGNSVFIEDNTTQQTFGFNEMPYLWFANAGQSFALGDFNNDGKVDIAKFNNGRQSPP